MAKVFLSSSKVIAGFSAKFFFENQGVNKYKENRRKSFKDIKKSAKLASILSLSFQFP
jgi:predicted RNase H-related nuclease YkuK (DUF458 family)